MTRPPGFTWPLFFLQWLGGSAIWLVTRAFTGSWVLAFLISTVVSFAWVEVVQRRAIRRRCVPPPCPEIEEHWIEDTWQRYTDFQYAPENIIIVDDLIKPPVRACCMKRHWSAQCPDGLVMCCICFERFPVEQILHDHDGPIDVCLNCKDLV